MPFGFGLRKARRYQVSSKNSYFVCVHMLDNALIECTLTADSTGQDCLENIAARINLIEFQYFGLRYENNKLQFRWVEMDKPLKKQLDKNAHSPLLYFGVMFYVSDVFTIQDDVSRYQYYLHLKTDVIENRLICSHEQAILLAAYSIQAELGDYDPEKQTTDYLNDSSLLPRSIAGQDQLSKQLLKEIPHIHKQLLGVPPISALLQYILEAQQLDGYGLEYFPVKDTASKDLLLGASFIGIFVKPLTDSQPTVYFKWSDILNFYQSKRQFGIETVLSEKPFYFIVDDTDSAKYLHKICHLQQLFYKSNAQVQSTVLSNNTNSDNITEVDPNLRQEAVEQALPDTLPQSALDNNTDIDDETAPYSEYLKCVNESAQTVIINDSSDSSQLTDEQINASLLLQLGQQQGISMHYKEQLGTSTQYIEQQGTSAQYMEQQGTSTQYIEQQGTSTQYIEQQGTSSQYIEQQGQYNETYVNDSAINLSPYSRLISSSQNLSSNHTSVGQNLNNIQTSFTRLPSYRSTPDYETVMRQRMDVADHEAFQQHLHPFPHPKHEVKLQMQPLLAPSLEQYVEAGGQIRFQNDVNAYSQPDIQKGRLGQNCDVYGAYEGNMLEHDRYQPGKPVDRASSLIVYPSRPNRGVLHHDVSLKENQRQVDNSYKQYRLPPPYPCHNSCSSPDLAFQMMSNSSPDLVSIPPLGASLHPPHSLARLAIQSRFDQSIENLAEDAQHMHIYQVQPTQSKSNLASVAESWKDPGRMDNLPDIAMSTRQNNFNNFEESMCSYAEANSRAGEQHLTFLNLDEQTLESSRLVGSEDGNLSGRSSGKRTKKNAAAGFCNPFYLYSDIDQQIIPNAFSSGNKQVAAKPDIMPTCHEKINSNCSTGSCNSALSSIQKDSSSHKSFASQKSGQSVSKVQETEFVSNDKLSVSSSSSSGQKQVNSAPRDDRRRALESKLEEGQVFAEFEQVLKKRVKYDTATASKESNKHRNRFKDVVPYEDNRVKLNPRKSNPDGYINASHIRLKIAKEEFWYIASQGPLADTVVDFWQMIWENDVEVVAMLTHLKDESKGVRYWPEKSGQKLKFGDYQVSLTTSCFSQSRTYVTSLLKLCHSSTGVERLVWHLQYVDWPDHGCPSNLQGFLDYLNELGAVGRQVRVERKDRRLTPIVVHCSAGVGRTGVVILTEMMKTMLEQNEVIDVPSSLKTLRDLRMYMVQTITQYNFVYLILILYLQSSRLI